MNVNVNDTVQYLDSLGREAFGKIVDLRKKTANIVPYTEGEPLSTTGYVNGENLPVLIAGSVNKIIKIESIQRLICIISTDRFKNGNASFLYSTGMEYVFGVHAASDPVPFDEINVQDYLDQILGNDQREQCQLELFLFRQNLLKQVQLSLKRQIGNTTLKVN